MSGHHTVLRRCAGLFASFALLLAGLLASASAASATPYPPSGCSVATSPDGARTVVTGSGFGADTKVALVAHSPATALARVQTDRNGSFRLAVTMPSSLTSGTHWVSASATGMTCRTGPSGGGDPVTGTTTTPPTASGGPANTGFDALTASAVAVLLLGGGVLLVLVGRRRRS